MELSAAWVGIIIVVLAHIVSTVWWAAKVSVLLSLVQKSLETLSIDMKALNKTYVSKEELAREITISSQERKAMWDKLDKQGIVIDALQIKLIENGHHK